MRHGRSKAARKTLQFFARTQGIKPPYHILLDGTFLVAVVKYKFPLHERLDKLLQHASFTLYTTFSCIHELTQLLQQQANQDQEKAQVLETTLQWIKKECTRLEHIPDLEQSTKDKLNKSYPDLQQTLSHAGFDILKLALQQQHQHQQQHHHHHKYFVACHDETVMDALRQSGGVPCIRLARGSVLLLEHPSKSGQLQDSHAEKKKWTGGTIREEERQLVSIAKEESKQQRQQQQQQQQPTSMDRHHQQQQHQQVRKKRKAKEPNPLSCKKSKVSTEDMKESSKKKRRRRNKTNTLPGMKEE